MHKFIVSLNTIILAILLMAATTNADEAQQPEVPPEADRFPPRQSLEIYGQLVELNRDDVESLIERPLADDPRGKSQILSEVVRKDLRVILLEWGKSKRATIKDISTDIVPDGQRARLCFVDTAIGPAGYNFGHPGGIIITKSYFDVRVGLNRDDTIQVSISPGLHTTVPPPLEGRESSQMTTFGADLKADETLVWGNFGNLQTPRVSLFLFSVRQVQRGSFFFQ